MPRDIEFWFDFASQYSYLSAMRIEAAASARGVGVAWKPFLLGPIFQTLGLSNSPFLLNAPKGAYMWQDMIRQCRKYGLAWTRPTTFPRSGLLALRVALVGAGQPWIAGFCHRVMELNFALDRDINDRDALAPILTALGLPAAAILDEAQSDANKMRLRAQTDEARERGIFGAPTFFVGGEMFWGNDRLDDALILAAEKE